MRRFEYEDGKSSKFWEIDVQRNRVITQWGRIGTKGRTQEKTFYNPGEARKQRDKQIKTKLAKGYSEVSEPSTPLAAETSVAKARSKKAAAKAAFPSFPGITDRKLKNLGPRLEKITEYSKLGSALDKTLDDSTVHPALLWHLVQHKMLNPGKSIEVLRILGYKPLHPAPEVVLDLLRRLPDNLDDAFCYDPEYIIDQYPSEVDAILFANYPRLKALLERHESDLAPNIQRGLAFVRARYEERIDADVAEAILDDLAMAQANMGGLNGPLPYFRDGELVEHRLDDPSDVETIATRFGTADAWRECLVEYTLDMNWDSVRQVRDALMIVPAMQLAELLATASRDYSKLDDTLLSILDGRGDDGASLLDAARSLENDDRRNQMQLREMFALYAARAFAASGEAVPAEIEEHITFEFISDVYHRSLPVALEGLAALGRERAHDLARSGLIDFSYGDRKTVICLAAHWDAELFDAYMAADAEKGLISDRILETIGVVGLDAIERSIAQSCPQAARKRHLALLRILADANGVPDERWDQYITYDSEGGQPINYYNNESADLRAAFLAQLPIERRNRILLEAIEDLDAEAGRPFAHIHLADDATVDQAIATIIEKRDRVSAQDLRQGFEALKTRAVEPLCRHISKTGGDSSFMYTLQVLGPVAVERIEAALDGSAETERDGLLRMAAGAEGNMTRVYLLHVHGEDKGFVPTPSSRSRSGGTPVGIAQEDIPCNDDGEPWDHLFTLDLAELPGLRERYPDAVALAFFCPDSGSVSQLAETTIVPIKAVDVPGDGWPIAVLGVDVPVNVFNGSDDPVHEALRRSIFNSSGHVGGLPLWIQEEDPSPSPWVMQVNESLADINLGDGGSLYVFEGESRFQCY